MIINTDELKDMIDNEKDFVLIDVRNESELRYGMIPKAVHLSLQDFLEAWDLSDDKFYDQYGFRKPSKNKLIVVYCRTGSRSNLATEYLEENGYNVKNYLGSVKAWSRIDDNVKMYGE